MIKAVAVLISAGLIFGELSSPMKSAVESSARRIEISEKAAAYAPPKRVRGTEIRYDFDRLKDDDFIENPYYYADSYELTPEERDLVERIVMHEAGWCLDYRLLILTAQCIRNYCELRGVRPAQTYLKCGYAAMSYANPRCRKAVTDVFDRKIKCVDEDIYCYYNSRLVSSALHESRRLAIDIEGNRFFY